MKAEDLKKYQEIKVRVKDMAKTFSKQIAVNKFVRMPASTVTDLAWLVRKVEEIGEPKTLADQRYLGIKGRAEDMAECLLDDIEADNVIRVVAEVITEADWLVKKIDELDRQKAA